MKDQIRKKNQIKKKKKDSHAQPSSNPRPAIFYFYFLGLNSPDFYGKKSKKCISYSTPVMTTKSHQKIKSKGVQHLKNQFSTTF